MASPAALTRTWFGRQPLFSYKRLPSATSAGYSCTVDDSTKTTAASISAAERCDRHQRGIQQFKQSHAAKCLQPAVFLEILKNNERRGGRTLKQQRTAGYSQLVLGHNWNRGVDLHLGHWQLNGILTSSQGQPLRFTVAQNTSNSFDDGQIPNTTGVSANLDSALTLSRWFDASRFSQPGAYTFGNVARITA